MDWIRLLVTLLLGLTIYLPLVSTGQPAGAYDWLQFGGDPQHSGNNTQETGFTPASVKSLRQLYQVSLPDVADGAPAFVQGVDTPSGRRDLLLLTTKDGHLLALDAGLGAQVWSKQVPAGACRVNNGAVPCFTTSSPAVDPNRQFVYSYGLDGAVHKYRLADGVEITGGGWPETATLKAFDEKGSSSLAIASLPDGRSFLYVTNSGYPGDNGDYQGHLTAINLSDGSQQVFNALCADQPVHFVEKPAGPDCPQVTAGIWSRAPVVYSPETGRIYLSTGNGDFNPAAHDWGDTVIALNPDGGSTGGTPLDSYTPANYQQLSDTDTDLGSTAPALLPALPGSPYPHLAVMGGKDGQLRLLNLDNLSGKGGPGHTGGEISTVPVPQGGPVLTQPAVWRDPQDGSVWVFAANGSGTAGLKLSLVPGGAPTLAPVWQVATGGTSPLVVNGYVFVAASGQIQALDARTGAQLWSDTGIGGIHWESPVVAGGRLYITDETGHLTAYGL